MGQHPLVLDAMVEAIRALGAGSGGTRNISGNTYLHDLLEAELADLHHREAALVFTSGYVANGAALSTLAQTIPGMIVLSDALNHASMIAGIRHSRAEKHIFRHNDSDDLAYILACLPSNLPKLVCFESVYSMDGDVAPPINYPTVPRGTERLRLTPTPLHSDAAIDALVEALIEVWEGERQREAA
jgi:5-aminolevulinate synthase